MISKQTLYRFEPYLRTLYALGFSGKQHHCPVCEKNLSKFVLLKNNDKLCPKCGSISRVRRLYELLNNGFLMPGIKVLDFSPSRPLYRKLKHRKSIEYLSTDLSGDFIADFQLDITKIDLASDSIDLSICYHILEHIIDDKAAINELYRILRSGGNAIVQTPFKEGEIYEDFSITSPEERERHFGQDDHVRIYSVKGLKTRLEAAGFQVSVRTYAENYLKGLQGNETVLILTKP